MQLNKDKCNNCGSVNWSHWKMRINESGTDQSEECDQCSIMSRPKQYDDIYKGDCGKGLTTDPNIYDPVTKQEVPYSSPGEKAAIMKRLQIKQADSAERIHGARNDTVKKDYSLG